MSKLAVSNSVYLRTYPEASLGRWGLSQGLGADDTSFGLTEP